MYPTTALVPTLTADRLRKAEALRVARAAGDGANAVSHHVAA
jgi:hypothetical protein